MPPTPPAFIDLPFLGNPLYLSCAIGGGAVLALQTLLLFIGGAGDVDGDLDAGADSDGFGFLSIRSIAAFLTLFGLVGVHGTQEGWAPAITLGAAVGAGTAMMFFVAWLFSLQKKLAIEGTLDPKNAVGQIARVYLRIPAENAGQGKITVAIQGRTAEFNAVTHGPELSTGASVRVVRQVDQRSFEVEAAD